MRKTLAVKDSLDVLFRRVANLPGNDRYRKLLLEAYTRELESLRQYNMDFIRRNKQSVVALYSLYQQVGPQTYVFSQEEDFKYFQMVDSCLAPRYPKVPLVNMLHRNVQEMGEQLRQRNLEQMLVGLGEPAPAFSAQGADGRAIHLSDLSGKYVLLVFWTSWNASCREFNKTLLSVYQKFKDEGLEIFQVSFDYTYAAWQQAVEEDGLVWKNGWEPHGTGSATARQYRVENLPVYLLIDPEGTVIARQLRPEQLIKKLEDVFHPQS